MRTASFQIIEKAPTRTDVELVVIDGHRYWQHPVIGLLPFLTQIVISHMHSPERDWLKNLDDCNSINCRLASWDREFWTFELNDKALAAFNEKFGVRQAVAA